jgi:Protein of unknown function (DUF2911)
MKRMLTFVFVTAFIGLAACAQDKESRPSPAAKANGKAGNASINIDYSQPAVKGRKIFGDLVPYGKVWRTGANEATVFETDSDIKVEGKTLAKGKYGLFTIPGETEWTIIFNKTWNQWGAFRYVQDDDVLRVNVNASKSAKMAELMLITVGGGSVTLVWDNTQVSFKVSQ